MHNFLRSFFSLVVPIALLIAHFAIMMCFINRWDSSVALTLVPIWMWAGAATLLSLLSWSLFRSRLTALTCLIWLATGLVCADENIGVMRSLRGLFVSESELPGNTAEQRLIRVVSLNCHLKSGKAAEAAAEVAAYDPDIVFLQEAPPEEAVEALARELFGEDGDHVLRQSCAILARGDLRPIELEAEARHACAELEIVPGFQLELLNLHLNRAITRTDIWRAETWAELAQRRRDNRRSLRHLLEALPEQVVERPAIIGGDFGTPANDDIYRTLRPHYIDSYREAGIGWPNTYRNDLPLLRIDQLWATEELQPLEVRAHPATHTDHRLVVTTYLFVPGKGLLAAPSQAQPTPLSLAARSR